ncbi:MAG: rRNA pseudouridine synthase [Lachnospiraceae bacterium]|nr:rRNA pseudouridine synthase [Lachnospiraceae bacterium]
MRLDKFLANNNIGTRSQVKEYLKGGSVTVNGTICKKADTPINEDSDIICFRGNQIVYRKFIYIILNKPGDIVTATRDKKLPTVMDLIKPLPAKDLFPVGRLDRDTTGLLLICNDGELSHKLLSPKYHVDKTYLVGMERKPSMSELEALESGLDIGDDTKTLPAKAVLREDGMLLLTIHEGRYHQVKRMLEAVDNKVTSLKRISFGNLNLPDDLEEGKWRELTEDEIHEIVFSR